MPEIPYEQLLQAQLGTLIAVFGIILLIVIGLTVMFVGVPLMRLLSRLADNTQAAQKEAQSALAGAQSAQTALSTAGTALTSALAENTRELKAQTVVLTELRAGMQAQEANGKAALSALSTHDTMAQDAIKRIEAALAGLREEISAGHKAQRTEVLGKLDDVLAEIRSLKPVPPPPVVLPHPDKLEKTA